MPRWPRLQLGTKHKLESRATDRALARHGTKACRVIHERLPARWTRIDDTSPQLHIADQEFPSAIRLLYRDKRNSTSYKAPNPRARLQRLLSSGSPAREARGDRKAEVPALCFRQLHTSGLVPSLA